jgi:ABC-type transport system involved in multi-copper enzyme maturation permease subunit
MHAYLLALQTALAHGISAALRRRRTHVAFLLVMLPALIPLLILLVPVDEPGAPDIDRGTVLMQMIETFYIFGVTPLLALFFAAMLIREDVESQTVSYLLTRPIPRSAWVLGKFFAYVIVCSGLIAVSIMTLCLTVLPLEQSEDTAVELSMLLRYQGVAAMSLLGYGAICVLLGAVLRHPVIIGALLFFGWQRIAMLSPGVTDLLTIQKYTNALLPENGMRTMDFLDEAMGEIYGAKIVVAPWEACVALVLVATACLALTSLTVREREYTTPVAVTE